MKRNSKLAFNAIHKFYTIYDSYTFKQNESMMDKPIYLGFAVLQLSELLMHQTYYDKLQPYFGRESLQLYFMGCDSFVLSIRTQTKIIGLKNLESLLDFIIQNENHELFKNKSCWKISN